MSAHSPSLSICLLAAGAGLRLKWPEGKPLVPFMGQPLIAHSLARCLDLLEKYPSSTNRLGIVLGHQREKIEKYLHTHPQLQKINYFIAPQEQLLGTADALKAFFRPLREEKPTDYTIVSCVDTPLIESSLMGELIEKLSSDKNADMIVGAFIAQNPKGLGRIVIHPSLRIVEEKDAREEERKIQLVNSGLYVFKTSFLQKALEEIRPSPITGEYYLTETCLFAKNPLVHTFSSEQSDSFLGINTPQERLHLEKIYHKRQIQKLLEKGCILYHPEHISIHGDLQVGEGCIIYPNVLFQGSVVLGDFVTIGPNCVIKNSHIENNAHILENSSLEGAFVGQSAHIGPMARIRPGSHIGSKVKIGNFVETKKVELGENVKISHLSYVGDAKIGKETNIGCGFITCNYDGQNKHETIIGEKCFIGSDTQMIAPITIGNQCFVASGSTINKDMPDESFAIARGRMELKPKLAKKFLK